MKMLTDNAVASMADAADGLKVGRLQCPFVQGSFNHKEHKGPNADVASEAPIGARASSDTGQSPLCSLWLNGLVVFPGLPDHPKTGGFCLWARGGWLGA
jgi:hypothetical protein